MPLSKRLATATSRGCPEYAQIHLLWEGELFADMPITTTAFYKLMQKSGGIAPHDARRTLLTDILNNGGSVSDAQFIAGHSNPQLTLGYAKVSDKRSREELRPVIEVKKSKKLLKNILLYYHS